MAVSMCQVIIIGVLLSFVSVASATPGLASFYDHYTPSACYGNAGQGVMIAAGDDTIFDGGKGCGKVYKVRCTGATNPVPDPCTGKEVTVKIVDHCPGCVRAFDLSKEAFAEIANPVAGVVQIDFQEI